MCYFDDLTYHQISRTLGIQIGAVATALHKARQRLESMLIEPVHGS
jgi:DNA-directed RNA polymerase specialized sigma24 family protein